MTIDSERLLSFFIEHRLAFEVVVLIAAAMAVGFWLGRVSKRTHHAALVETMAERERHWRRRMKRAGGEAVAVASNAVREQRFLKRRLSVERERRLGASDF
ncbi:MAG: hypothetical protein AAFR04_13800 [Pseudomonadota bacterium]